MKNKLLAAAVVVLSAVLVSCATATVAEKPEQLQLEANDKPWEFVFSYNDDMQLPELPTGCEATAASTLMRMHGYPMTKTRMADALPKSETDFVTHFLGDPYSESGWACSAPCVTRTMNRFFAESETLAAVELTGTELAELPLPSCVWVTIDLMAVQPPVRVVDGYGLFRNSHCVVVRGINGDSVSVYDPLVGITDYPRETFTSIYNAMGKQAVYVTDRNTAVRMIYERGNG